MNSANMKEGKVYYHAPTITVELLALLSLAFAALWLAAGCSGPRHYWKGADIGWAIECESRGLKFYNRDGQERECTALMNALGLDAVIVPFFGPMTAFWPVFAVIVPLTGPMTALGGLRRSQVCAALTARMRLERIFGQRGKEMPRFPQFRCRVDSWMPPRNRFPVNAAIRCVMENIPFLIYMPATTFA